MAVYTDVSAEQLDAFLDGYDIGELLSYKGIAEGVENSNFLLHATSGHYILTLYEKRVASKDLPFFLGLMEHLAARGINCPQPVKNRKGETLGKLAGRPAAIVTFLDGMWIRRPSAALAVGPDRSRGEEFEMSHRLTLAEWAPMMGRLQTRSYERRHLRKSRPSRPCSHATLSFSPCPC